MVPIVVKDADTGTAKTVAIIDVDCAALGGFDEVDQKNLEELATLLSKACDW